MKKNIIFILTAILLINTECTKNFDEINTDKTELMEVTTKELAELYTYSQIWGLTWLHSGYTTYWANSFCGYFATQETSNEQMSIVLSKVNSTFKNYYTKSIAPIVSILSFKDENPDAYYLALIWRSYVMYQLADTWGPIPYFEAGNGGDVVPYDSVEDIYYDIFDCLEEAVDYFTEELADDSDLNVFGENDIIYGGDISKWVKFANTMRLRLAIRISNVDPDKAQVEAEAAVQGDLLEENDDNAWVDADVVEGFSDRYNALARISTWDQVVMTTSMESFLKGYNDPRMEVFFSPVEENSAVDYPEDIQSNIGGYHGIASGYATSDYIYFSMYSQPGPMWYGDDIDPYAVAFHVKFAAETWFLKAEGAWRGWSMGGTAQEFYEKGIETSITQWRKNEISDDSIQSYINSTATPINPENYPYYDETLTDIPVKFSSNSDEQFEQIITQKWLALYPDSWEAWAEYRRTRLPQIFPKKNSQNDDVDVNQGQIITRLTYASSEVTSQPEEITKAIILLGGDDTNSTPIWWDVNDN